MKTAARREESPLLRLEVWGTGKAYGTLWFGETIVGCISPSDLVAIARTANLDTEKVDALTDAVLAFYGQRNEVARG